MEARLLTQRAQSAAAAAVALFALAVFAHWLATLPARSAIETRELPMFAAMMLKLGSGTVPALAQLLLGLVAVIGIAACGLSLFLLWQSARNASARRLAAALALVSLAVTYFFFVLPYNPYFGWLQGAANVWTRFLYDLAGYLVLAAGLWQLAHFFEIYPRVITPDDWKNFIREQGERDLAKVSEGWRRQVYPQAGKPAGVEKWRINQYEVPRNPWTITGLALFGAALLALIGAFDRTLPGQAAASAFNLKAALFAAGAGLGSLCLLVPMLKSYRLLDFHRSRGLPDDRLRIEWIYSATLVGGIVALALPLMGLLAITIVVVTAREASPNFPIDLLLVLPYALALPVFAIAFLAALALSIFYRGAVDPRLAARKITVWWLLGALVALLFVFVERAVAVRIVQWLGMPHDTGYILAGALVAGTFAPVRHYAEKSMTGLVGRILPVERLMDGERRSVVVAMSDLSGYTALSVQDEKQALLIAALLHRKAAVISEANGGRLVKSIGDAVMLEFPDADRAAKALITLHAEFPAACRALGFEPLPVHSGAHLGEVVVGHDGDLFGQTVNLAARLQGEAKSGQIVVSTAFVAARTEALPEAHRPLGPRRLKNIPEAVDCHELVAQA